MFRFSTTRNRVLLLAAASLVVGCGSVAAGRSAQSPPNQHVAPVAPTASEPIAPYRARFGRQRPIIAIVGVNSGTELTDYVVVPAVVKRNDPTLLTWIKQQAAKGGTLVSICDGALVLAQSGVLDGHRATAHWATADYRRKHYPQVNWIADRRYVADGRIVSSAGISAAIPTSLALVEAIAGHERAAIVAAQVGAPDWSPAHDSHRFAPRFGRNLRAFATTQYLNGWLHKATAIGVAVAPGADEITVALTADAYSRTGRAKAFALGGSTAPILTRHGLTLLPDRTDPKAVDRIVALATGKSAATLDRVLAEIARLYGKQTAFGVALDLEYPGYHG